MNLPSFTSEKSCPRCRELLHWSERERPPSVNFDHRTGRVWSVSLMRFCISCGYREAGFVSVAKDPTWTEMKEE